MDGGDSDEGSTGGCAKAALATAKRTGITEVGFLYSDQRSTTDKGAVRCQLRRWERGKGVAVTEQWDEDQEGGGGRMGRGRLFKRLRRLSRVTAADAFPNAKRRRDAEVTNRSVPRQDHVAETERDFAKGLESSAPTVNEESEMPTVQKPKRGAKQVQGKGGQLNFMSESQP